MNIYRPWCRRYFLIRRHPTVGLSDINRGSCSSFASPAQPFIQCHKSHSRIYCLSDRRHKQPTRGWPCCPPRAAARLLLPLSIYSTTQIYANKEQHFKVTRTMKNLSSWLVVIYDNTTFPHTHPRPHPHPDLYFVLHTTHEDGHDIPLAYSQSVSCCRECERRAWLIISISIARAHHQCRIRAFAPFLLPFPIRELVVSQQTALNLKRFPCVL